MKYLPFENLTYKSRLTEAEIINRLTNVVQPERTLLSLFTSSSSKPYEGKISGQAFVIKRIITRRNSFLPSVKGIILKDFSGTTIEVKMRLAIPVIIFLFVWCGIVGLFSIFLLSDIVSNAEFDPVAIVLLGMLLFVYAIVMLGFKSESRKTKKFLQEIFDADIIQE